jgi:transcriptional regulator GlxA family with amidase domain
MLVTFLLFDGFQPIDLAGPWQAFATANEEVGALAYRLVTTARQDRAVSADGALKMHVDHDLEAASGLPIDMLVVPGGPGIHAASADQQLLHWLRDRDQTTRRTCSVCTGAFLLAAAGLLDGREVTTHWRSAERLRREFPALRVNEDKIYCESEKYWTTAGVTAGIDLALALIERDHGADISQRVARRLVVYLRRDGDQRQYSQILRIQDRASAPFRQLIELIEARLEQDWSVDAMAVECNMSRRSFQRKFTENFGMTPMAALHSLRRERAEILASSGRLSGKEIQRHTKLIRGASGQARPVA